MKPTPILFAALALLLLATPAYAQKAVAQSQGDPVIEFSDEDAAMNAAIENARRTLPQFLAQFDAAPARDRENYMVKVGMDTIHGHPEHIWVGDLRRENGRLVGVLANAPVGLAGLGLGSRVVIDEARISDWSIITPEGMYGSYTTRVMLPHLDAATRAQVEGMLTRSPTPAHWTS